MSTILDTIVQCKKEEVAFLQKNGIHLPQEFAEKKIDSSRGFRKALLDYQGLSVIAEVKKASPSKGVICENFHPVEIAENYQKCGAQAVSVLTDQDFFQGDLSYMMQVREAIDLPVIRKDFIIDPLQIEEAALCGADAILLIAAILDKAQLRDYQAYAKEFSMDCLVEVHDEKETEKALAADVELLGVNNRNLKNFTVDIQTTFRIQKMLPKDLPLVSESGLQSAEDLQTLKDNNICAALIGESLMRLGSDTNGLAMLRGDQ